MDGREGMGVKVMTTSHDPHGVPSKGANEGVEHFDCHYVFDLVKG